jgi:serine O-acetyltransferase
MASVTPNMTGWYDRVADFIGAYRRYDPAAKSSLEIALLYPGPKAILFYRVANFLYQRQVYFVARLVSELARILTGIEIHPGAKIGRRLVIDHGMGVVIGETAEIGDDCILFHGVTLGGSKFDHLKRHPTIGSGVLIGAGAKILGAIEIGDRTRVGANAVVTKSVGADLVVVGNPSRIIEPEAKPE